MKIGDCPTYTTYSAPHWQDNSTYPDGDADDPGDRIYPVCYSGSTQMRLSATWRVGPAALFANPMVKGDGPGAYDIPPTGAPSVAVAGNELTMTDVDCPTAFTPVDIFDPMEIEWSVSPDGGAHWLPAGKSRNQVYVTLNAPNVEVASTPLPLHHTFVHIGCQGGKGKSDEDLIFTGIWGQFTATLDDGLARASGTNPPPHWQVATPPQTANMTYYKRYDVPDYTASQLLRYGDGQCRAWAYLLIHCNQVHGLADPGSWYGYEDLPSRRPFVVKTWHFPMSGHSGHATYPFVNTFPVDPGDPNPHPVRLPYNANKSGHEFLFEDVTDDTTTLPGQGNRNPASLFANHQFVERPTGGFTFYDPSYGQTYTDRADCEAKAIEGYWIFGWAVPWIADETTLGADFDRDGTIDGIANVNAILFQTP